MRHDIYKKVAAMAAGGLLLLLSLLSCSDGQGVGPEVPEEPRLCKVIISLQSPSGMRPATRAEGDSSTDNNPGTDWEDDEQYERLIREWVVAAYDNTGVFAGLVTNTGTPDPSGDDSQIATTMELPEGDYTFFAFANWSSLDAIGTLGDDGNTITDIKANLIDRLKTLPLKEVEGLAAQVGAIDEKYNKPLADSRKPIPMSSYGHLENLQSPDDRVSIPLIRMIGKVQVSFNNQLDEPVTISEVKVGKFQDQRPVFWTPWGDNHYLEFGNGFEEVEHRGPFFPDGELTVSAEKEYHFALGEGLIVDAQQNTEKALLSCYVNESMISSETHTANMVVNITRKMTDGSGEKEIESRTDFAFVRRNDLLKIPVLLSNYSTTLGFREVRLPIGVFPKEYKFGEETGVQVLTPITYSVKSAGHLKVTYTLQDIINSNCSIRYKPEGGSIIEGMKYSSIRVMSNPGLLIDPDSHAVLESGKSIAFTTTETDNGSFTLCTQELGKTETAQILLTLIVEYGEEGNKRDIEIPYTINITNAPQGNNAPGA